MTLFKSNLILLVSATVLGTNTYAEIPPLNITRIEVKVESTETDKQLTPENTTNTTTAANENAPSRIQIIKFNRTSPPKEHKIKEEPTLPISDLWLTHGDQVYSPTDLAGWIANGGHELNAALIYDGNANTAPAIQSISIQSDLNSLPVTGFILRLNNHEGLEKIKLHFLSKNKLHIIHLKDLSPSPDANLYQYSFANQAFTAIGNAPETQPFKMPELQRYIRGLKLNMKIEELPGVFEYNAERDCNWAMTNGAIYLQATDITNTIKKLAGQITLTRQSLSPGGCLAFSFQPESYAKGAQLNQVFRLGYHNFRLTNGQIMRTPDEKEYVVCTSTAPISTPYTIVFNRGTGFDSETIDWKIIGPQHNRSGRWLSNDPLEKNLTVMYQQDSTYQGGIPCRITDMACGKTVQKFEDLPKSTPTSEFYEEPFTCKMWEIRAYFDPTVQDLKLDSIYGPATESERLAYKSALNAGPMVRSNIEGSQRDASRLIRGSMDLFHLYKDLDLLNYCANSCANILEYRNGGPHYSFQVLPQKDFDGAANLDPDVVLPVWPTFKTKIIHDGEACLSEDLDAAIHGMAILMYFAEGVSRYPELYEKKLVLGSQTTTYRQFALKCLNAANKALSLYVEPFFIDPDTQHMHQPWRKSCYVAETYHLLAQTQIAFKKAGIETAIPPTRTELAQQFVKTFLTDFFSVEENLQTELVERNGIQYLTAYPSSHPDDAIPAMAKRQPENLHEGCEVFEALYTLYDSGAYPEQIPVASVRMLADHIYYSMFKGFHEDGLLKISESFAPSSKLANQWEVHPAHIWVSISNPDMYAEMVSGFTQSSYIFNAPDYAMLIKIRENLFKQGYLSATQKLAPQASILTINNQQVPIGKKLPFSALNSRPAKGGKLRGLEWDFNQDGITDSSKPKAVHAYIESGTNIVSLKVIDSKGNYNYAFHTLIVE